MTHTPPTRARSRRALVLAGAVACVLGLAAACSPTLPSNPPSNVTPSAPPNSATTTVPAAVASTAAGLLILSGPPGLSRLALVGADGSTSLIELPPRTSWVSTNGSGRLVATSASGDLWIGDEMTGRVAWRPVAFDPARFIEVPSMAALSPDGAAVAVLAARIGDQGPFDIVLLDLPSSSLTSVHVTEAVDGLPQWVDDDRLTIRTHDSHGRRRLHVIERSTGVIDDGPEPVGEVSIASAARSVVGIRDTTGDFFESSVDEWLARGAAEAATISLTPRSDRDGGPEGFATDPSTARLAVAWSDADGNPTAVAVYSRAAAWRETARLPIPAGSERAVVAWLR